MLDTSRVDINKQQVLTELERHVGRENGIHVRDLVAQITNSVLHADATERKVRDLVAELRAEGQRICAHPASGYYIAANNRELDDTCRFLLERATTSVNQIAAMKGCFAPDLYASLGLKAPVRQPD
jgi:hypothetical protein